MMPSSVVGREKALKKRITSMRRKRDRKIIEKTLIP
jgi:hypothetical protein